MNAARVSLALALLTGCRESDDAWYSARSSGSGVDILRVDVENDSCIYIGISELSNADTYPNVDHKPSSQRLGLASWRTGAEECSFANNPSNPVSDVSGEIEVEDIRMGLGPFAIGCRVSFDLTFASDSLGEVHAKAVDLAVVGHPCKTAYREPVELRDLTAATTASLGSFEVYAWEPNYESCARASFTWWAEGVDDPNPAETPPGWLIDVDVFRVEQDACNRAGVSNGPLRVSAFGEIWGKAKFEGGGVEQPPCSVDIDLTANMDLSFFWVPPRVHFRADGVHVDGC